MPVDDDARHGRRLSHTPQVDTQRRYVVRKPSGDPDAARRLAAAYDACADALVADLRLAVGVLRGLGEDWSGSGARAARTPEQVLSDDGAQVARALRRSADEIRNYAHKLARAHEHHGWSIGKLVTMGAMVTIGAAAIVVTVGGAAPVEAAAAAAAVEGAEAATAAATTAGAEAGSSLGALHTMLAAVRPLAPFVVPHLVSAASSVGVDAASQLLDSGRLDLHSLEVAAAVGFAGSSMGATTERALAAHSGSVRRLAEGGLWAANGTAGAYADEGHVDPLDSLSFGLTGVVARDFRRVFGL